MNVYQAKLNQANGTSFLDDNGKTHTCSDGKFYVVAKTLSEAVKGVENTIKSISFMGRVIVVE